MVCLLRSKRKVQVPGGLQLNNWVCASFLLFVSASSQKAKLVFLGRLARCGKAAAIRLDEITCRLQLR